MKKILVFGDIHGRSFWKEVIMAEQPTQTIFLGDYVVSRENVSEEAQLENLADILQYKEEHADEVILLRGNHDTEAAGYRWAECYPDFESKELFPTKRFEQLTQWMHQQDGILFSHAGVSRTFLADSGMTIEDMERSADLNDPRFGFTPLDGYDTYGNSITQTPLWIRPEALITDMPQGLTQVVGHTTQSQVTMMEDEQGNELWLCDALRQGSYLCIEEAEFVVKEWGV